MDGSDLGSEALHKGLSQLCEEGATQLFKPLRNNDLILGAVGQLQFEVVAHRLEHEYGCKARIAPCRFSIARWVTCDEADGGARTIGCGFSLVDPLPTSARTDGLLRALTDYGITL